MANYPGFNPYVGAMYPQNVGYPQNYMQAQNMGQIPSMPGPNVPVAGNVPAQPQAQNGFICVPVTSREEAVATRVEAFGPPALMPDFGHGMIYFKRFNEKTALADFAEFKLVPEGEKTQEVKETQKGPDLMALVGAFQGRFDAIEGKFDGLDSKFGAIEDKVDSLTEKFDNRARRRVAVKGAEDE